MSRAFRRLAVAALSVYVAVVLLPVAAFAWACREEGVSGEAWGELARQSLRVGLLANSFALSAATAVAATAIGVPVGFLLSRTDVAWRRGLLVLVALPLFLPPFLWATAWQAALGPSAWAHGMIGSIWVMTVSLYPIVALLSGVGFARIGPALEEAALLDGREGRVFWHVVLPLARPLIVAGSLIVFILTLGEFGAAAVMQVKVFPVAVYTAFSASYDFGQAALLCLPLLILAGAAIVIGHRVLRGRDVASQGEGVQPRRIALARGRVAVSAALWGLLIALPGLPILALAGKAGGGVVWDDIREPTVWGLALAAAGATVLTALGLLVGWCCQRRYVRGGGAWLAGQLFLFALPSTVLALGLVSLWNRPVLGWVYGTAAMVVLGYVARFIPLMVRAFAAHLAQIPTDCEEAVAIDGGGAWVTFRHVVWPLTRRAGIVLWTLVFVLCMGELAVTILVSPPGLQTLGVRLFTIEANAPEGRTASLALALVAGCLAPLVIPVILQKRQGKEH